MKKKFVYIGLTADTIHHGHINLIENAKRYGNVIVGLLTDKAVSDYKRLPLLSYEHRKKILMNIKGVEKVVAQNEWDYSTNIRKFKPEYMLHGNDWIIGSMSSVRKNVIKELKKYGGKLIEIPYTKGVSSTALSIEQNKKFTTPELRLKNLRRLLEAKSFLRIIETHSPISALIAENSLIKKKKQN